MKKFITKAEFANYLGVNKSQVSRAVTRGRITQTAKGMIDWKKAEVDWEAGRTDTLKGRNGRANNKVNLADLDDLQDVQDVEDICEDTDDSNANAVKMLDKKGTKAERLQAAILKEAEAKASLRQMQAEQRSGLLFERNDVISAFGAVLSSLKMSILAWPTKSEKNIIGLFQEWLKEQNIIVDASQFAPLETRIITLLSKESNTVLESVKRNDSEKTLQNITDK